MKALAYESSPFDLGKELNLLIGEKREMEMNNPVSLIVLRHISIIGGNNGISDLQLDVNDEKFHYHICDKGGNLAYNGGAKGVILVSEFNQKKFSICLHLVKAEESTEVSLMPRALLYYDVY